ncbi:GDSL esterase/lipase, partial [Trifolium medium]|nr:GDSL esterase/lipase [Trifolium medium]
KRWPTTHVLLITPPPIDEDARLRYPYVENPEGLPERTNEAAGEYARACIAVATECRIPSIDLWTKMQQSPDWKKDYL